MRISDWSSDVCSSDLLRVDRIGVFVHLAVQAQEFHGEDAIGDLATEELDRVLGHSLTREAEIDRCCEAYCTSRNIRGEQQESENCEKDRCDIHFSSIAKGYTNQAETLQQDRKSTRLNSSQQCACRMPSYACTKTTQATHT